MAKRRYAAFDYSKGCITEDKRTLERQYNAANFRVPFQINLPIILTLIVSISVCQFAESVAERQVSSSHGKKHYDQYKHCSERIARRSMGLSQTLQSIAEDPTLTPQDVLSRLEAAAVLRDNLVTTLGRVLLLCLNDNVRIPFERIHDAVRNHRVAVYEFLPVLPALRDKLPKQRLFKLLQMLERVDNRFVSEYASLCINAFSDIDAALEQVSLTDMLLDIDQEVIESISRDKRRAGAVPPSLMKGIDFLLQAARDGDQVLNMRTVSAILLNYPAFDLTNPEIHSAIRFIAERLKERGGSEDALLQYMGPNLKNATHLLKTVLERLEADDLSSEAIREASSLLLQNFNMVQYPPTLSWRDNLKKLLMATSDYYPVNVTAAAKYLLDHLDDSHIQDLDIGFYETGDHALLQMLSRLREKARHLRKPLSLLIPFVSQKLASDTGYVRTVPISFYEVNDYLDSFDTPCLQQNISDAMKMLRPHLSEDLPWTYAFGDGRASSDPWELFLASLIRLRNVPMNKTQANVIDNFIYEGSVNGLTPRRGLLYDSGVIFQRGDSTEVEVDFFSLLTRIPNAFKSEKFAPMLNFMSKRNVLNFLGYEFNKFEYKTPRSLLLAVMKRALTLSLIKSDESLFRALQNAHNYLEEPLLINMYTAKDLQLLLKHLPYIDSDPRYLPLKILFKKEKLFTYLSPTFSLADVHTPMERLALILKTVSLKATQPKLSEALSFAINNINEPPLPIKTFDRSDFVYLVQQLLSRNEILHDEIFKSYAYTNVSDWNVSISGTPENVLARALNYPIDYISLDTNLAGLVKQAEDILEEGIPLNTEILKQQTLEAMLEYLPNNTYVKPVNLLLRKANLMALVPKLNLASLETATARDALITLLKNLTESPVIRAEKLLLRRVRAALSSLDGTNGDDRQTPIFIYLIQSLQDPSNIVYQPLLLEISKLKNLTISPEERQDWLQNYFQHIIDKNETESLTKAAAMILREITYDERLDEASRAGRERIAKAVSILSMNSAIEPLKKLLTPDWAYGILPEEVRNSDSLDKEELLLVILHHAKQRADVANNFSLMRAISKIEASLKKWRTNVESLKNTVAAMKAAVYDPVRKVLTAAGLNKIKVTVPSGRSAKVSLLGLLHRLQQHPVIKKNDEVFKLLSTVRQDVFSFGVDVDLLIVLDDAGIAYTKELGPIRLFLHRTDINEQFGQTVLTVTDSKKRYRTLLHILQRQGKMNNDTQFLDALSILKNIQPDEKETASTLISDLEDIVNTIPHRVRQQFKHLDHLFNAKTLSRLTNDNEIVKSKTPLIALLSRMANLPEVSSNYAAAEELNKLLSDLEHLSHPIITGFQLRPLLLELGHVQQINVDYFNSILNPEVLSYLNTEKFLDTSNDNVAILKNIVDYLLREGPAFVDYNMQKHLQSFKRTLELTVGSSNPSKRDLTKEDWEKMLALIPHEKDFVSIKIFLQSGEILKYVKYKDTDWKMFPTPAKKLIHLLSLMNNNEIGNENVYKSAKKLRRSLEKRYNFITEKNVQSMHRTLASLTLKHDLTPLKIFLNHDNMIKYLSPDFKYASYSSSTDALAAVLDNLLQLPSLKKKVTLYDTMRLVRQTLREQVSPARRSFRKALVRERLSSKDLEFVGMLNMSLPKLREFLKPEKLASLLPESCTFDNQPTFKTKALHLLRQLLKLNTDVYTELQELLREVEIYPDVPDITEDDLVPLLNILPVEGIPYLGLVKKYLKPTTLIKLLPGDFNIKQASTARVALHDVLLLLSVTVGSKIDNLRIALDALISELTKISSEIIPYEPIIDSNEIRSIIKEIPFKQYKQITQLESQMTTRKVVLSLPLNFQLTEYKTKKLRVLAVLNGLSRSNAFRASLLSISFAKRIVSKMPDVPMVNDTEIEKLLLPLPLNNFYVKLLVKHCKLATLMPYLPIHFNLSSIESRKLKITKILYYCKQANPTDVSTKQALITAETELKKSPDVDATRDHVEVLIRAIPCTHFTSIKPLLRFLSHTDVASLLPWDLDLYRAPRTFKLRIFDLLSALRNVKKLQNDEMFSALDTLETNVRSLPEQVAIPQERIATLRDSVIVATAPCSDYRDFVLKSENLIQILPPNFHFQFDFQSLTVISHSEWSILMHFSALFLLDVRLNGPMKNAFEACRDSIHQFEKEQIFLYLFRGLNSASFQQLVPLKLYALDRAEDIAVPVEDVYRAFPFGSIFSTLRVMMREFISRPGLIKSKSLINDMEVFLHDYLMTQSKWIHGTEVFYEIPSPYEIDRAIGEIPSDHKYNDLRLLTSCQDIQALMARTLLSEDTPKQLLLQMLEVAESGDIDDALKQSINTLKPYLVDDIHAEEVEYALKQMRDYRYHAKKVDILRKYFVSQGLQRVLGYNFTTKYPTYKDRLFAINDIMLNNTISRPADFSSEYRAASEHLNRTLHNEIKIEHVPRTVSMDDINVQSLFFALPKTRDEKIIRGVIKFFSVPNLLRTLKLPKDPFEYVTKGRLLRAIMDLGQELKSVQQDPVQQEALEYFRDKIITDGPSAQPIELKKYARDSNVDVDLYGVMRAIDYAKANEIDAVKVATFFERKYDNLVHAVGFDHTAYATRGAYLKALFEHLVNVSQVPDDVKQRITSLIPAVRLDGPGEESVDLNTDIVYEKTPSMRMFEGFMDDKSQSLKAIVHLGTEVSNTFQEYKESLNAAVDTMLETISSSEEEYLEHISEQFNDYDDKTRIVIGAPGNSHVAQQKLDIEQSQMQGTSNSAEVPATKNRAEIKKKNNRSIKKSLPNDVNENRFKIAKSKKDLNWQTQSSSSDYLNEGDDDSFVFEERIDESPSISSQKLLTEKLPKKSHSYRASHKPKKNRGLPIQSDKNIDIEYDDSNGNAPIVRIFHDMSQNKKSLSLTEKLIAEHANLVAKMSKTVRKVVDIGKKEGENIKEAIIN